MTGLATVDFNISAQLHFIDYWDIDDLINYSCPDPVLDDAAVYIPLDRWDDDIFLDYGDTDVSFGNADPFTE